MEHVPHPSTRHSSADIANEAPVTVPLPRVRGVDWPGDGDVAFVPAALLLAASGRCSCAACVEHFTRRVGKTRLHAV